MGTPKSTPYERYAAGLIKPQGMRAHQIHAEHPDPIAVGDRPLPHAPERPCTSCGKVFQPSLKRRLLCKFCFGGRHGGGQNSGMDAA